VAEVRKEEASQNREERRPHIADLSVGPSVRSIYSSWSFVYVRALSASSACSSSR
jgi:hypothetical protein